MRRTEYESRSIISEVAAKADSYLRREDTRLANFLDWVCSEEGEVYAKSRTKRMLDICVALPAAVVATPAMIHFGLKAKKEDSGTMFFVQERMGGRDRSTVKVIKIRSMRENSDNGEDSIELAEGKKESEDPRVTKLGEFLRLYKLDELPQLWGVVFGHFSVVGLRVAPEYIMKNLLEEKKWESDRLERWLELYNVNRPGLTGLNQIFGNDRKEDKKRFHYDAYYANNQNLGMDLYLLWRTIMKMRGIEIQKNRSLDNSADGVIDMDENNIGDGRASFGDIEN